MPSTLEDTVHSLMQRMFPFHVADGWAYKGFAMARDDGRWIMRLRFEKRLMDRLAFAVLDVFTETVNAPGFDLRAWILQRLREQEGILLLRHRAEFAGAC